MPHKTTQCSGISTKSHGKVPRQYAHAPPSVAHSPFAQLNRLPPKPSRTAPARARKKRNGGRGIPPDDAVALVAIVAVKTHMGEHSELSIVSHFDPSPPPTTPSAPSAPRDERLSISLQEKHIYYNKVGDAFGTLPIRLSPQGNAAGCRGCRQYRGCR